MRAVAGRVWRGGKGRAGPGARWMEAPDDRSYLNRGFLGNSAVRPVRPQLRGRGLVL